MDHIDLTISTNYVPDWGVWEGTREFIQNALDHERETEEGRDPVKRVFGPNRMDVEYNADIETLSISSKGARLERRTLLLGEGTKRQNGSTIGQHGEGYKLAFLSLLRHDRPVRIFNGDEVWTPSFAMNEELGAEILRLTFEKSDPVDGVQVEIQNFNEADWETLQQNVRMLHDSGEVIEGETGCLLTSDEEMGRLYVGGIFVTPLATRFLYGYDFNPNILHLDRDRSTVDSFNLVYECGKLMAYLGPEAINFILRAVKETKDDIEFALRYGTETIEKVNDLLYDEFRTDHGDRAFPVSDEYDAKIIRETVKGVKPVIVNSTIEQAIKNSPKFDLWKDKLEKKDVPTPEAILRGFMDKYREYFPQRLADLFNSELIQRAESEEWSL